MTRILILILAALVIGLPVGVAFALPSIMGASLVGLNPTQVAATVPFQSATSFSMLAIPFFLLAGQIMKDGGLMERLIRLAEALLHWLKGALGYVAIAVSAMLGAMTGSSVATVAAVSSTVGDRMIRGGYNRDYTAALTAASGLLGVMIPPSIPLIIYATVSGVSVSDLFIATIVPGLLMVVAFMLVHRFSLKRAVTDSPAVGAGEGPGAKRATENLADKKLTATPKESITKAFLGALPALFMPVVLLGGIYSGIFTPTEAAAAAGLYALVLVLLTRGLRLRQVTGVFYRAALPAAAILTVIAFASSFNRLLTLEQIPQRVADAAVSLTDNMIVFLLLVNLVLILVGMVMETNAAVLLMAPLLVPAAMEFGIDPIHFGIILVTNIEIGLITPPLAANIFVAAKVSNSSVLRVLPHLLRFILTSIVVVLVITYVPALTLWNF